MNVDPMNIEEYYFPVNLSQVQNLVGKMLTHVEAMNLPKSVENANKDLVRQSLWKWWESAQENSLTSWKGCIGPIYAPASTAPIVDESESMLDKYIWFTDIGETMPTKDSDISKVAVIDT